MVRGLGGPPQALPSLHFGSEFLQAEPRPQSGQLPREGSLVFFTDLSDRRHRSDSRVSGTARNALHPPSHIHCHLLCRGSGKLRLGGVGQHDRGQTGRGKPSTESEQ